MSGYGEMAKDEARAVWVSKWVCDDEELPELDLEQYRFTLARARSAEAEVKALQDGIRDFDKLIRRVVRDR